MKIVYLSTLFILFMFAPVQSQNNEIENGIAKTRVLSYQELLDEMANCNDSIYKLNNAIIQYDIQKDERFLKFNDSIERAQLDTIRIKSKVILDRVSFIDYPFGGNKTNKKSLSFLKINFEKEVSMTNIKIENELTFYNCRFDSRTKIIVDKESLDNRLLLSHSAFNSYTHFEIQKGRLTSYKCDYNPTNKSDQKYFDSSHVFGSNDANSYIILIDNYFYKKDPLDAIYIADKLYSLRFFDNTFDIGIRFSEISIEDLTIIGNTFNGLIDMANVKIGNYKSEFYFDQLGGNIGVYSNEDFAKTIWRPENYKSFSDSIAAERFFNVYRKMTDHFRNRGNLRDYNKMFIEMKDFETMQLHYYFEIEKNVSNWFSWKMNLFLGIFSDYGTSPIKAVLYSIKVIFIFALFFFFFHNDWDTFSKEKLMSRMRLLVKYFRSDDGIAELYEEQEKHRYKNYEDFITYMRQSKNEIPHMFLWISKPLYFLSTYKIKASNKFLKKAEILDGKWFELKGIRKLFTSISISIVLIFYLISSLFMKVLNALMLSINTFTTLGFGEIPTRGIGRYAAIIEGFIGWFLLTLFSVSLITQLLQ